MTLATVLCPVDFSEATAPLVAYAAALAAGTGAELRVLHVLQPKLVPGSIPDLEVARQLAYYHAQAVQVGAQVSTAVHQATEVALEIVAEARRCSADLIVIGAHGRTSINRFLMGSTAETVVRTAPCVTLLLKPPAPAEDAYRVSA
jgi:nucleotide-binding universal stress UspA family protein